MQEDIMKKSERIQFIKVTEKMVSPKKIASIFQGAEFLRKLPKMLQKKIMEKGAKTDPYISFIVEPYSIFLAYEIRDEEKVAGILPENYELINSSMFEDTKDRKCIIIGAFNVHTSVFWGNRVELYIIAKNRKTGLVSWIIHEYETNTISYDPRRGFIEPGTRHSVLTTSCLGELILDVDGKNAKNRIQVNANIKRGRYKKLNKTLWIEGNLSVDYGGELSDVQKKPFGLIFDPAEMREALFIDKEDTEVIENTFFPGVITGTPFEVCCFPYAQHFYTTSIPVEHAIQNEKDLEKAIEEINRRNAKGAPPDKHVERVTPCPGFCYNYACKNTCRFRGKNKSSR
jgi:hypothetical protein